MSSPGTQPHHYLGCFRAHRTNTMEFWITDDWINPTRRPWSRCVCALLHFPWPAALQQCAAYAAATGSSDVLLLTNCRQAGAAWSSTDRQLCISNASRNWVSHTTFIYISHYFTHFCDLLSHIPSVDAAFLMIKLSMGLIIAMIRKTIPFY